MTLVSHHLGQKSLSQITATCTEKVLMNTLPTSLVPEDQIKSFKLSYFDYHLLLVSLCHSIDTNTDLLVRLIGRPRTAPDRSEVAAQLRADSANLKQLYQRLVGDQA